jgi:hypothetical protein
MSRVLAIGGQNTVVKTCCSIEGSCRRGRAGVTSRKEELELTGRAPSC